MRRDCDRPTRRVTVRARHRSLAGVLASEPAFAEWSTRHRRETSLTEALRRHLPRTIAERVRVTDSRGDVLELAATAGAIAATLRQRSAGLRSALARDGFEFADVRVRVQVAGITGAPAAHPRRRWDSAEATPLFELADELGDSPLKHALARWSRRARGR